MRARGRASGSPRLVDLTLALRAFPFASHCIRQLIWPSYWRDAGRSGDLSTRLRIAAYDGIIGLLLDGYAQLARHPLRPRTGALVVRLNRLVGAVDDEYEHRLVDRRPLDFAEVFAARLVQDRLGDLAAFLRPYPERLAIKEFLQGRVSQYYGHYVTLASTPKAEREPDWHLRSALLDSVGLAECIANVIGLFHRAPPGGDIVRQFASFGMMVKVADDVIDFWDDLAADRANLLQGIVLQHPVELERVRQRAQEGTSPGVAVAGQTGLRWWRDNCPESYAEAAVIIDDHRSALTAPRLRLACELVLVPAWHGRIATSGATIGLRQ
jgi:hypothetical protein